MCLDTCTQLCVCAVSVPFGVFAAIDVCGCVDVSRFAWPLFAVSVAVFATVKVRGSLLHLDTCARLGVCAVCVSFTHRIT